MGRAISSVEELSRAVGEIQERHPDLELWFRGQRHDRPLVPSAARFVDDPWIRAALAIFEAAWSVAANHMIPVLTKETERSLPLLAAMAVLQHYGFKSWFVDVTADAIIGAWFAVHNFQEQQAIVKPTALLSDHLPSPYLSDYALARVSTVSYVRSQEGNGFLYVIGAKKGQGNPIHLERLVTNSALRIYRQRGGALFEPFNGDSVSSMVIDTLVITPDIDLPGYLDSRWLFPPPFSDQAYRHLFRLPWAAKAGVLNREAPPIANPMIDVPLYLYDPLPEPDSINLIRVLIGADYPSFWHEQERTGVRLPLTPDADTGPLTGPPPRIGSESMERTDVVLAYRKSRDRLPNLSVWGTNRLVIFYPITYMIPTLLYRRDLYPIFRGLKVDIDGDDVAIVGILEDLDGVKAGTFSIGEDEQFREHFYFLTDQIERGRARLRHVDGELHFEWDGWFERRLTDPLRVARETISKLERDYQASRQ